MARLFLLFHGRFPSEKAASLFTAKNAEAFADQGIEVIVLVPRRNSILKQDVFDFYKVKENFKVVYLPTIDLFSIPYISWLAFWVSMIVFSQSSFFYIWRESRVGDVIYSNEILPLFLATFIRPRCFYEMHDFPESKSGFFKWFLQRTSFILVHNKWKIQEIKRLFPSIPESRMFYEPNAVDLKAFDIDISLTRAKERLGLPLDKKIVIYTGHLYGWKGVDTLAHAAALLDDRFLVVFVGGTDEDLNRFRKKYDSSKNILIAGRKLYQDIPLWQKAADVLVLPNTAKEKISAYYTSPMKLFEYMASKRPIIASDIPSIREILNTQNAVLVSADNPDDLAKAIEEVATAPHHFAAIVGQAFKDVSEHTWQKRAGRIISFIESHQ